jgi:hypothetical protein
MGTGRPKADGLRHVVADGARGVLMATACCAPDARLVECRQIWELGREDEGGPAGPEPWGEPAAAGRVHVVGTTR